MKPSITGSGWAGVGAMLMALVIGLSVFPAPEAQAAVVQQEPGGRFRVLVVPLMCRDLDKNFGKDVAEKIRDQLEDFSTHAPIPENEYKRALKRYEVKEEEINAIKARQLANLMGAQVVYFGSCTPAGGQWSIDAGFILVASGDEVTVPDLMVPDKSDQSVDNVAGASIEAFQEQVKFVRARQFCADYVGSQQPENALRNCNEALAINSNSAETLMNKGLAFRQLMETDAESGSGTNGWADSAVVYFELALEVDPGRREALSNAAYIYSQKGDAQKASQLYKDYLELDPANVPVRLKVAYDLAQANLMPEAIEIIDAGLEFTPDDVDLLQSKGDYALRYSSEDPSYVEPALAAYERVLEIKGEETELSIIENALAAYTRAERTDEAIAFAELALESHADSPRLWSLYADALGRAGRTTDASAAMDRVLELDSAYPNGYLKRGQFKLEAGDSQGAMADFDQAIASGTSSQDDVYRLFYSQAGSALNEGRYADAVGYFEHAEQFAPADKKREVEFYWGYAYYQLAEQIATPENAGLSQLQRAEQNFGAAKTHFEKAGNVRSETAQLVDACDRWLLNVQARIKQIQRG